MSKVFKEGNYYRLKEQEADGKWYTIASFNSLTHRQWGCMTALKELRRKCELDLDLVPTKQ